MVREFDAFLACSSAFTRLLDVGANHGIFTMAFCAGRPDARALAVEPSSKAFRILEKNLEYNGLPSNVSCKNVAAGDRSGSLAMFSNWHHLEVCRGDSRSTDDAVTVEMETLDSLVPLDFAPELVKVDVEGFEYEVLRGAERTLEKLQPTVFLEIHPEYLSARRISNESVIAPLEKQGYRFEDLSGKAITRECITSMTTTGTVVCLPSLCS